MDLWHRALATDRRLFLDVNSFSRSTQAWHGLAALYAVYGGLALLALLLLWAWWQARRAEEPVQAVAGVVWVAAASVIAWALSHYGLKPLIARPRPFVPMPTVLTLIPRPHGYSFPSGHATVAGALIAGLWIYSTARTALIGTLAGLLLSFDRVYVGVHYPGDVLGGLVLGALVVTLLAPVGVRLLEGLNRWIEAHTPFGVLVRRQGVAREPHSLTSADGAPANRSFRR
jgi:membrane-associated phospholipid phosphatase